MSPVSIVLLALAMSTDAFAAAVAKGTALNHPSWREALRSGAIFGLIEGTTPLLGWCLGQAAARYVETWDHWIAFVLLCGLGVRMILAALDTPRHAAAERPERHSFVQLATTGLATSIDALAVGVGLAFIDVAILPIALTICLTTSVAVSLGVKLGAVLGAVTGKRAELVGGVILVGIGATILVEHLSAA